MTVFVETDFLIALVKDSDWLKQRAETVLEERAVVTSPFSYLELLIIRERHEYDYVRLFANMLELVPVRTDDERQIVLKAVHYYEEGMTPFDSFHAALAETHGLPILSSDTAYEAVGPDRLPLEPDTSE
ncbi:PIN domain-containing protein [Natronobiforma cellulositropha]|uniref:PIN domain-containing protein n=1 Tax=Natronobiforma cellulositropha TaxID=1679076 RepID=UPI0021D5F684|nr:PIN domain-containing protein [Natronobiforma cellulositropha]